MRRPGNSSSGRHLYTTGVAAADAKIAELLAGVPDAFDRMLLSEMMTSTYRLADDQASTGDLKILNAALKELRYAFKVFRPYRHIRKVAAFGSARLESSHPAYAVAQEFGAEIVKAGWMMITGAASGIMKAGHEGAGRERSFGLNIRLPFEQEANPVIASDEKLINCKYFFTRKLLFIKESHATALFPGGFGTLDEGFESLTLVQTGKSDPRPIVFIEPASGAFWQPLLRFFREQMLREGVISPSDCSIYSVARSPREAVEAITGFYSVYHSLRYVGRQLVMRLQHRIPEAAVTRLAREFKDILGSGTMEQREALPEEADEQDLASLPRLVFHFNRRQFGRLTELVHRLNELGLPETGASQAPRGPRRRPR